MTRILVVEDDGALRYDLAQKLVQWGYEVLTESDGALGFDAIEDWQPDVVLSDINMPNHTGFDLMHRVKQLSADYAGMIFLFVSSRSGPTMVADGICCGADDYITKPIDYALLKAKIESHLRKRDKMQDQFTRTLFRIRCKQR